MDRLLVNILALLLVLAAVGVAHADEAQDHVVAIITDRAAVHGVSLELLIRVAWCESRLWPGAVGDRGESLGLFQLHRRGLLPEFYRLGYVDAWSAWEQADFTARMFAAGRGGNWSCA